MKDLKKIIVKNNIDILSIDFDLKEVFSIIEKIKKEGSVFLIKVDGERVNDEDIPNNTILISGGLLKEDYIRKDDDNLSLALCKAIKEYNDKIWDI